MVHPIVVTYGPQLHENGESGVALNGGFYGVNKAFDLSEDHPDRHAILHYGLGRLATDEEVAAIAAAANPPQKKETKK